MSWKTIWNHPLVPYTPAIGVALALVAASGSHRLSPGGPFPRPLEMLGWLAVATLAGLHRPRLTHGDPGVLAYAALVVPAAMQRLGVVPAALVSGAAVVSAAAVRQLARRRTGPGGGAAWPGRGADNALFVAGSVLVAGAGAAPEPGAPIGWRGLAPAGAYLATLFLLRLSRRLLERRRGSRPRDGRAWARSALTLLVPSLADGYAWTLGIVFHDVALGGGWAGVAILAAAYALLAGEAARSAFLRRQAEQRTADLERLQFAHQRILAETSGMGGIAQQILTECRNILPVGWYQFEHLDPTAGTSRSWAAGGDGVLVEGAPRPEERPGVLPGVHRRASWRILEKRLEAEGETLAIVRLWCDPRRLEPGAEELFTSLLPQMASSVHRARLDREAKLDPLTGVPVRRLLESSLQRAYATCMEEGWSMAVILCDIDHFKKINDTYGHDAGDEALKLFAHTLDTHRRENDLCCRYGGEEFTLLLENTDGEAALGLAERLRGAVESLRFHYEGQLVRLTFSSGVAAFPELHIKTASELLLLADEALYEAKEQGRNRCLLNLGRGAFRGATGAVVRSRTAPSPPEAPYLFG